MHRVAHQNKKLLFLPPLIHRTIVSVSHDSPDPTSGNSSPILSVDKSTPVRANGEIYTCDRPLRCCWARFKGTFDLINLPEA